MKHGEIYRTQEKIRARGQTSNPNPDPFQREREMQTLRLAEQHQNIVIFFFGDNDVTLSCRGSDRRSDPRWQFRKGRVARENLCE